MKLTAARLDVLIWSAIYGGLFVVGLGIALGRAGAAYGAGTAAIGALAVAAGIVLVWVRSRLREP